MKQSQNTTQAPVQIPLPKYGVKHSLMRLSLKAREAGAALALYGHSHRQEIDRDGEITLLNPGALKNGDYAVVELDKGCVRCELHNLDE